MRPTYDTIGRGYARSRRADPRLARRILRALGDAASVVNVGAGTGSYEPGDRYCLAVEPSTTMIRQRAKEAAPAVQGRAENLPLGDKTFDAALAVLTVHHWADRAAGLAELRRVARRRVVILTWDQRVWNSFWLMQEYFPACDADRRRAVPIAEIVSALADARVTPVPIPHDCVDGFHGAFWRRPAAYLEARVRAAISTFAQMDDDGLAAGLERLAADLASGDWERRHRDLLQREELDLGYRLIVGSA